MIFQLSAILQPLLQAGVQFGTQFLNRELSRDARRQQKDLLKAQARASGLGQSFVSSQSPGTVAAPFSTPVALPPSLPGPIGPIVGAAETMRALGVPTAASSLRNGVGPTGAVPFATSRAERFVLDKASGCLRLKMPGEKGPTFKLDAQGDFVRVRPRRMNPLNPRAARRASKRIDAALRAVKQIVSVSTKKDKGVSAAGGKVVRFRTSGRKRKSC